MKILLVPFAIVLMAGCASQPVAVNPTASPATSATLTPGPSPSPSSTATPSGVPVGTPVSPRVLAPAPDLPFGALCSTPIQTTANGNAGPLFCRRGEVNVQAWSFYASVSASILGLGLNPTEGQAEAAICDDFNHNHATKPEETNGYALAAAYYGWSFGKDPTLVMYQAPPCQ